MFEKQRAYACFGDSLGLPVKLQTIHGEQKEDGGDSHLRVEVTTAGRNNEAVEQLVMRLSIEDEVSSLSWSVVDSTME
jgi:putative Mg2+ transporter-C (MgtC) family protein